MAEEKKTTYMWIKVDLQCHRCRKKIKKVLCKFPQIQDQVYDEKENYVIIKVVCCSPEKIKQKIKCKGGDTIKCIEIKEPEPEKKNKSPPKEENPKKTAEPSEKENKPPPPKNDPGPVSKIPIRPVCVPVRPTCCTECSEGRSGGPCLYGPGTARPWRPSIPNPRPAPVPQPVPVPEPGFRTCCTECYEGRDGGPCHYGQGRPPPCYDGYYYGRPIYDSYDGGYRSCYTYVSRCEETSSGCTIM